MIEPIAYLNKISPLPVKMAILLTGFFTLLFFATYFLYFKKANQNFADESLSEEELPMELLK